MRPIPNARRRARTTPIIVLVLLAAGTGPAAAQEPDRQDTTVIPLEPLTVQVLMRPSELRDLPYAVTVNAADPMQRGRPGLGLDEMLRALPGVQVDNRFNTALGERVSIRGFGARAQFGVRGIKILVDGIPATLPDGQSDMTHIDPRAIERVEVIRGPASSIYGNAAGGVLRLETTMPRPGSGSAELMTTAGANGLLRTGLRVGGGGERLAYTVDATRFGYDGHREHNTAERWHATARTAYSYGPGELQLTVHGVSYEADNPGALSREQLAENRAQAHGFNVLQGTGKTVQQTQAGLRWLSPLGAGDLELAAYAVARDFENPIPPAIIDVSRGGGGLRAVYDIPAQIGERDVRWTVGVNADGQFDDRRNFENEQGEAGELTLSQEERVLGLAGFVNGTASVTDRLRVLAGIRFDGVGFRADDRVIRPDDPDDSGSRRMSALSPSVGAVFAVDPSLDVYTNVATAFETPTTTELANRPSGAGGFNPELEPQRTRSVELGVRGRIGEAVAYDGAVFRAAVRDALIPFEVPDLAGRQFFRNAGSATHTGVELGASLRPIDAVDVRTAYSWVRAVFDEYATEDDIFDGNRVPGVAPHRLDVIIGYRFSDLGFVDLETRYVGEVAVDDANSEASAAYTVTDLRAGLDDVRAAGMRLSPFMGVTNVFDSEYNAAVTVNAFGGRYYEPAPGRSAYLGVRVRLGGS